MELQTNAFHLFFLSLPDLAFDFFDTSSELLVPHRRISKLTLLDWAQEKECCWRCFFNLCWKLCCWLIPQASLSEEQPDCTRVPICPVTPLSRVRCLSEKSTLKYSYQLANLFLTLRDGKLGRWLMDRGIN